MQSILDRVVEFKKKALKHEVIGPVIKTLENLNEHSMHKIQGIICCFEYKKNELSNQVCRVNTNTSCNNFSHRRILLEWGVSQGLLNRRDGWDKKYGYTYDVTDQGNGKIPNILELSDKDANLS